jgi:hypothetical protein
MSSRVAQMVRLILRRGGVCLMCCWPCGIGDGSYPGLAAAMHVIDLAARGDAGPLRHVHAAGSAQGRYRPYAPQGADMGPAPGGGY